MTFKIKTNSKAAFKDQIVRKRNQFKRFCRRFTSATNTVEKRFLKTEATQIVKDLKQFCNQWKKCGFGPCAWITSGCNMSKFKTTKSNKSKATRRFGSKRTPRKSYAKRRYARRTAKSRTSARRSYARKSYGTRSRNNRRSYVAW